MDQIERIVRNRIEEYHLKCKQATRPLMEACRKCTRVKVVLKDGKYISACKDLCELHKLTQVQLNKINEEYNKLFLDAYFNN